MKLMGPSEVLTLVFRVSRPRFWFYLAGPYAVGCIWATKNYVSLLEPGFFLYMAYFLFPANILLYGINDHFDFDTDQFNEKKSSKEHLLKQEERGVLKLIILSIILSSMALMVTMSLLEAIIFGAFLFLCIFYSTPPLRFKARPLLDSSSNILYVLPSVFAFYRVSGTFPIPQIFLLAFLHTFSMHLFSAIPDIESDLRAGLKTTATQLGARGSEFLCLSAWGIFSLLTIYLSNLNPLSFLTLIYPLILVTLLMTKKRAQDVYWFFPHINIGLGATLFLIAAARTPWS